MIRRIMTQVDIGRNLGAIKEKIQNAVSKRSADLPDIIPRLVAVSKTKPKDLVIEAYAAGVRDFGENYVQEILEKGHDEEVQANCPEIKWHFIGHLQSNKINKLLSVPNLNIIETIDSLKLATAVNNSWLRTHPSGEPLNIFLQINTSGEPEKSGVKPEDAAELAKKVKQDCPGLNILGLMTIGAYDNYDQQIGINPDFKRLRDCREAVAQVLGVNLQNIELSMGMSGDFEHAVLLDGTICHCALKNKVNLLDQLPKYLDGNIKLLTTRCVIKETELLGINGAGFILKQYPVHECGHNSEIPGSACILSMLGNSNESSYFVATQDRDLQEICRKKPGVPILYLHRTSPTLEAPSSTSQEFAKQLTRETCSVVGSELQKFKELKGKQPKPEIVKPRKRRKQPNSLSCKKKKKPEQIAEPKTKNPRKRKRSSVLERKVRREVLSKINQ